VVFAGFALFIWWRLVKDDYRRGLEEALDEEQEAAAHHVPAPDATETHATETRPTETRTTETKVQS
jgi:hypothetical protein